MKEVTLFDSFADYSYDEYAEWCEINDIEAQDENSEDFYDYKNRMLEWDFEDFMTNLKYSKYNNHKCAIVGTVGTWRGRFEVVPTICNSLVDAVKKTMSCCDYYTFTMEDNVLHARCVHHDGTNCFNISLLDEDNYDSEEEFNENWLLKFDENYLF